MPVVKRKKSIKKCDDSRIRKARDKVDKEFTLYAKTTTESNRINLKEARANMEDCFNTVQEEELSAKISEIDKAQHENKYKLSWKLINEISGRRSSRKGQIEGNTKEERINSWYTHFQWFLGNPPQIQGNVDDVAQIFDAQNIDIGPFTLDEYQKAKRAIVEGKACGEDNITPEIIKRCSLDSEILEFYHQALLHGSKPEQWSIMHIIPIPKTGDLSKVVTIGE